MVFFITLIVGLLVACGDKVSVSFSSDEVSIKVEEEMLLEPVVVGENLILEWSSSDEDIVVVSSGGLITGVSVGEALVTVKVEGKDASATIKVVVTKKDDPIIDDIPPIGVIINEDLEDVKMGDIVQLTATVLPAKASQEVIWSTSNSSIATITNTGKVSFVGVGNVTITAKAKEKETIFFSIDVVVKAISPTEIIVASSTGEVEMYLYDTLQLVATVNPESADEAITWSVDNPTLANISEDGKLEAINIGDVVVKATSVIDNNIVGSITITILPPLGTGLDITFPYDIIQVDETMKITAKVLPMIADQAVTFSSSDDDVATVDAFGNVVGISVGTVDIVITSVSNESLSKTYSLEVIEKLGELDLGNYYINSSLKDAERYSIYTLEGVDYVVGVTALGDFDDLSLVEGSLVVVAPGVYTGNLLVNKNEVTIKSEKDNSSSLFNNIDLDDYAVLKGKITIAADVEDLEIIGLAFTDTGKVEALSTLKGFLFADNYVFDTVEATNTWSYSRDYNLTGFLTLWKQGQLVEDVYITHNRFNNVSETNIIIGNTKNLYIEDNEFKNFDRDAIRIDGGHNFELTVITGNVFANDELQGYNGIYFRSIGEYGFTHPVSEVYVEHNKFINIGTAEVFSGAISANAYQESGAIVNINHNYFEGCFDYIWLRNNATAQRHEENEWIGNINYNIFIGVPDSYYHRNIVPGGNDTSATNPSLVNMDYNFYADKDGNVLDYEDPDFLAMFYEVGSLNYSYISIEAMSALYVDASWAGKSLDDDVSYLGMNFKFGEQAFATIQDAVDAAYAGQVIIVLPGEYNDEVAIKKSVVLKSTIAELSPNENLSAFSVAQSATIIKGLVTIENASNVSIKGFTFTGAARIRFYGPENAAGVSNFLFENNFIQDTTAATIAWQQATYAAYGTTEQYNTTIPGFLVLAQHGTWMRNFKINNNRFENVSDTNIYTTSVEGIEINNNVFVGGDRDAIRLDYGSLNGVYNIKNNVFDNFKYNGIYIRSYAFAFGSAEFNIENNDFINLGNSEDVAPTSVKIGAIATMGFSEANSATFNIRFNYFENNFNYISIRANVSNVETWNNKDFTWVAYIEYNAFIDEDPVAFYFRNLIGASDTELTNTNNVIINHNFYGSDEDTKVLVADEQFDHHLEAESNLVIYDSLQDLLDAIDGYVSLAKPFIVNAQWDELEDDDVVTYNGVDYVFGEHAFSSITDAIAAAVDGKTIIVLPGTYKEGTAEVLVDNLKIHGPNAFIDPSKQTRVDEAVLEMVIKIGTGVKNTEINGLMINYITDGSYVVGHEDGNIEGFKFSYNIVNGSVGSGAFAPIRFMQLSSDKGNKDFLISYNIIRNVSNDRGMRIAYIENLSIIGNSFIDNTTDVIRLNDNGGSVTGKLLLEENTFLRVGQFALFTGATTVDEIIIINNVFDTMATHYAGGALSIRTITPAALGTAILINGNKFIDHATAIRIDHNQAEGADLDITVGNNEFKSDGDTIYTNTLTGALEAKIYVNNKVFDDAGVQLNLEEIITEGVRIKNAKLTQLN